MMTSRPRCGPLLTEGLGVVSTALLAVCLLTGISARAAEPAALSPGKEAAIGLANPARVMKVYLPSNYDPKQKWPAVFFYHGAEGSPDTGTMREYAGGKDYVIVGMPYAEGGDSIRSAAEREAYLGKEAASFKQALEWTSSHASLDRARIFMAGVSKGGWTTAMLGERQLPLLAGFIVLAAGRPTGTAAPPQPGALHGKAVYIGAGETDPNLIHAVRAREIYRRGGATVTFEEYMGVGHHMPPDPKHLKAWLAVHGPYAQQPAPAEADLGALKAWFKEQFAQIVAEADPLRKYTRLMDLAGDPRLTLCGSASISSLQSQLAPLRAAAPAKDEWTAEQSIGEILWKEVNVKRLVEYQAVRDAFKQLAETYPQTQYGKLAAAYYPLVAAAYQKSADASRQANPVTSTQTNRVPARTVQPSFPTSGTKRGKIMHREGNRVWFE